LIQTSTARSRSFSDRLRGAFERIFVDPLAVKELSGIARRWQTYVSRSLYVAVLGVVVWIFRSSMAARGGLGSPSALAELAHGFFVTFIALQMLVTTLGGVSAGSDLITREVRNGTLGLLALTPLSTWRIATGKWKAAMIQTSTSLVCGLPVYAILVYLGGMGLWELAYTFTLSAACTALGSAIGLFWSTVFRAGYVATIVSILTLLGYCILPTVILLDSDEFFTFLTWVHPLYSCIGAVSQGTFGGHLAARAVGWIPTTFIVLAQVGLLLRWTASRIQVLILDSGFRTTASLVPAARTGETRTSRFAQLVRGREGVWDANAILWKELSTRRMGVGTSARVGLVILGFFLFTALFDTKGIWRVLMYWLSSIVFLLVSLASGVSLFVTEREEKKWDVLLSTPLESSQIVLAKLLAGLAGLMPLALTMAGFWSCCELLWSATIGTIVMNLVAVGSVGLLAYVMGAAASLHARSQRVAFSSSFGVLIGLLFVFPILLALFQSVAVSSPDRAPTRVILGSTNPVLYMSHVSEFLGRSGPWHGPEAYLREQERELWPLFQVFLGVHVALIGGLAVWMIRRFDRATGRC
jgi:ABC-type transport system involved in multi-copper enzyme maturation permease subunit